jgi:XapX domain-containing protein
VKPYLVSLAVGILVGGIYALLRVRSPAPPVIALAGLLGILIGEQGVGMARGLLAPPTAATTASVDTSSHPTGKSHAP